VGKELWLPFRNGPGLHGGSTRKARLPPFRIRQSSEIAIPYDAAIDRTSGGFELIYSKDMLNRRHKLFHVGALQIPLTLFLAHDRQSLR